MPSTTTNMGLNKPTVGADSNVWGGETNANWDSVDALALIPFSSPSTSGAPAYNNVCPLVKELCTGGGGGITRTLPTAVGHAGKEFFIKKIDSGAGPVSIATTSSQTIDGVAAPYVLANQNQYIQVMSDNANWTITANN